MDARGPNGSLQVGVHGRQLTGYGEYHAINGFPYKTLADKRSECRKNVVTSVGQSLGSEG
jgi:hypothetical protein